MKKCAMVRRTVCAALAAVVAVALMCSVALADWSADYTAWKAQPVAQKYAGNNPFMTTFSTTATADQLKTFIADNRRDVDVIPGARDFWEAAIIYLFRGRVVRNESTNFAADYAAVAMGDAPVVGANARLYALRCMASLNQTNPLADSELAWSLTCRDGWNLLANAPDLFVCLPTEKMLPFAEHLVHQAPGYADRLTPALTCLANNYAGGTLSGKDYVTLLNGVKMASVSHLNTLAEDSPEYASLKKAISGIKTSLAELQISGVQ